jgi:type IV pilus assembly protein PilE
MSVRPVRGFTLIEMVIVVTLIAVLASIAIPSYRNYVVSAQRTIAKSALVELQARQEGYYVDRKRYATLLTRLAYPADPAWLNAQGEPDSSEQDDSIYQIVLEDVTVTGYTLSAIPVGAQADDSRCGTLTIVASGRKSASGSDGLDCWR